MNISPTTKAVGLIGHPVAHSISPQLHNSLYRHLGMDMVYCAYDILPENFENAVKGMAALGFTGFNITIPYKEEIIRYLDEIDPEAAAIGAVNTVKIKDGRLIGFNTDGKGFIKSLKREGVSVSDKSVLIIGAGGSARAISIYAAKENASRIIIYNRTIEKARELSDAVNSYKGSKVATEAESIPTDIDLIINTTPLGMWPSVLGNPLSGIELKSNTVVCDIVYNPRMTSMLKQAVQSGCKTVGGIGMLIGQALDAVEIWIEKALPENAWAIMTQVTDEK